MASYGCQYFIASILKINDWVITETSSLQSFIPVHCAYLLGEVGHYWTGLRFRAMEYSFELQKQSSKNWDL